MSDTTYRVIPADGYHLVFEIDDDAPRLWKMKGIFFEQAEAETYAGACRRGADAPPAIAPQAIAYSFAYEPDHARMRDLTMDALGYQTYNIRFDDAPSCRSGEGQDAVDAEAEDKSGENGENPGDPAESAEEPDEPVRLRKNELAVYEVCRKMRDEGAKITIGAIEAAADFSLTTTRKHVATLREMGLLELQGARGQSRWIVHDRDVVEIQAPSSRRRTEPKRRFTEVKPLAPAEVKPLAEDHPAVVDGRTVFPSTVVSAEESPRVLISGEHSRKLGDRVTKGAWAGMPIFSLTLEERATCPATCHHWRSCYGNGMQMARRHAPGAALERGLYRELIQLQAKFPDGFVVRLHVLGDFYSLAYVDLWATWLDHFPALHVFGYTAWPVKSEIGYRIRQIAAARWERFAVRTSVAEPLGTGADAVTTWSVPLGPRIPEGLVCPAEIGKTACCGTCGLCWAESFRDETIVFVAHGPTRPGRTPNGKVPERTLAEADDDAAGQDDEGDDIGDGVDPAFAEEDAADEADETRRTPFVDRMAERRKPPAPIDDADREAQIAAFIAEKGVTKDYADTPAGRARKVLEDHTGMTVEPSFFRKRGKVFWSVGADSISESEMIARARKIDAKFVDEGRP